MFDDRSVKNILNYKPARVKKKVLNHYHMLSFQRFNAENLLNPYDKYFYCKFNENQNYIFLYFIENNNL